MRMPTPDEIDRWRVVPRLLVTGWCLLVWRVSEWFMGLDAPIAAQSAFVVAITGLSGAVFGLYVNSGPNSRHKE